MTKTVVVELLRKHGRDRVQLLELSKSASGCVQLTTQGKYYPPVTVRRRVRDHLRGSGLTVNFRHFDESTPVTRPKLLASFSHAHSSMRRRSGKDPIDIAVKALIDSIPDCRVQPQPASAVV